MKSEKISPILSHKMSKIRERNSAANAPYPAKSTITIGSNPVLAMWSVKSSKFRALEIKV